MAEQLPVWNNPGIEPSVDLKTNGWQPGQKPSAQHFNWLFNRAYKVLEELQSGKVDKIQGKGLSTNDFTNAYKQKLDNIGEGANVKSVNGKTGDVQITSGDIHNIDPLPVTAYTTAYQTGHSVMFIPANNEYSVGWRESLGLDTSINWYLIVEYFKTTSNNGYQKVTAYRLGSNLPNAIFMRNSTGSTSWNNWKRIFTSDDITDSTTTDDSTKVASAKAVKSVNDNLTSLQQTVTSHSAGKVHQGEVHGMRVTEGKFEYFDGQNWQRVKGDGYPVGNVTNFRAVAENGEVKLTWGDPADVTITDSNGNVITIARWKGTKILRKTGSYPQNENDGVLVVDNGVRNQYAQNGFIDTGLTNGTTYYYMAFPYTEEDVYTVDEVNRVEATPAEQRIYGVRIDKNNSNPETRVTYIRDAVGFTPMRGNNGNFSWGSWQSVFESFEIKPCVLKNKQVRYYLNPNDFTKKADGSPAKLTGVDGDVMIEFGKPLWWKWTDEGATYTIEISDKAFDGAVKHAFEIEEGYNLVPYYALLLTQILFVIFFKSTDSQTALGRGCVDGNGGYTSTGNTNNKGMFFGETTGKQQMKFLGMEDYWGNKFWWIDGLVTDSNYNLLIGKGSFNDNGRGYQTFASGVSSNTAGYIDSVQGGNDKGFIIKSGIGSETTYYADYGCLYSSRVAYFGGNLSNGSSAGFAHLLLIYSASNAYADISARLFCASNGKIYVGAYLGTTQNGKLRSISGTSEPTGTKTIGTFRTEARANN